MAGVGGNFRPKFDSNVADHLLASAQTGFTNAVLMSYAYIGEKFINDARRNGTYKDRTGNLRTSVGYVILIDGKTFFEKFDGKQGSQNRALARELARELSRGIVLICMAGMGYAAAVESRGYDVITGSTPTDRQIETFLRESCKQYLA